MSENFGTSRPYEVLANCRLERSQVSAEYDPTPQASIPVLRRFIEREWIRQKELAAQDKRVLFNGQLLRLVRWDLLDHSQAMQLTLGATCYRDFVGTNLALKRLPEQFPWEVLANPVGTSALVLTPDPMVILGRRSESVLFHPSFLHTFGGMLESCDRRESGEISVFDSMARELEEELNLGAECIADFRCTGLLRDPQILQPELIFEVRTDLGFEELKRRWQDAASKSEHSELVALPCRTQKISEFLNSCGPIAPVAQGAMELLKSRLS